MINNGQLMRVLLCAMLWVPLSGCAATVGQQFRDIMAEIDAKCRNEKMGPYLDPDDPNYIRKRRYTDCDILKIKPADPLATEEGRFAYSIKLPPPHDKLKASYRPGMSAERYFKELCEKDAGDIVFRTVENVDGIKILRAFPQKALPFQAEMTASFQLALWDTTAISFVESFYSYVDAVEFQSDRSGGTHSVHYYMDPKLSTTVPPYGVMHSPITESQARYGYTFRATTLPEGAREDGIRGGELVIMDIVTKEVLAYRRIFTLMHFTNRHSAELVAGKICMNVPYKKDGKRFIAEVLKPTAATGGNKK